MSRTKTLGRTFTELKPDQGSGSRRRFEATCTCGWRSGVALSRAAAIKVEEAHVRSSRSCIIGP